MAEFDINMFDICTECCCYQYDRARAHQSCSLAIMNVLCSYVFDIPAPCDSVVSVSYRYTLTYLVVSDVLLDSKHCSRLFDITLDRKYFSIRV